MMWDSVFIGSFVILLLVPFLPALREWQAKTDAQPLDIQALSNNQVKYFADKFKRYAQQETSLAFVADDYLLLEQTDDTHTLDKRASKQVILSMGNVHIPSNTKLTRELISHADISSGDQCNFYALHTQQDIYFGDQVSVQRWMYANSIFAGHHNVFHGSVFAEELIQLEPDCQYHNLQAKLIRFGRATSLDLPTAVADYIESRPCCLPSIAADESGRWIIEGDLSLADDAVVEADIIAKGRLRIGKHSVIKGNVKAYGQITVGAHSSIEGSLVSQKNIKVSYACRIHGQVIAEQHVELKPCVIIGRPQQAATLCAHSVHAAYGVHIYGAIKTRTA